MDNLIDSVAKDIRYVIKRSGDKVVFKSEKIEMAILNAMKSIDKVNEEMVEKIARLTTKSLFRGNKDRVPNVDEIHDMVENKLMDNGLNDVAKEYIIYRSKNQPNIFSKRINLKPYEYPNLNEYVDAIRHSYWVHTEFNYTSDIQDYKVHLNEKEKLFFVSINFETKKINIKIPNTDKTIFLFTLSDAQRREKEIKHLFKEVKWAKYFDESIEKLRYKIIMKLINSNLSLQQINIKLGL